LKTGVKVGALLVVCSGAGVETANGLFVLFLAAFAADEFVFVEFTAVSEPPQAKIKMEKTKNVKTNNILILIIISQPAVSIKNAYFRHDQNPKYSKLIENGQNSQNRISKDIFGGIAA